MFKSIRVRASQGSQFIPDPRRADPTGFRGRPVVAGTPCQAGCQACAALCPTQAITLGAAQGGRGGVEPVEIDLGRCTMCGDCGPACPSGKLSYASDPRLATTERTGLRISAARPAPDPVQVSAALRRRFGRSLKLRSVSAGGCNACELEVNALSNVNFDIGRYGIDIVASPRHADALVLTGPISRNMALALQVCWDAMPAPKLVIAVGACAISGSPFEAVSEPVPEGVSEPAADGLSTMERSFLERFSPSLYVPGCPPHPLSIVCGLLDLLGID